MDYLLEGLKSYLIFLETGDPDRGPTTEEKELQMIASAIQRIIELEENIKLWQRVAELAFKKGYGMGHNDTVESAYNGACEHESDCFEELLQELIEDASLT